MPCGTCSLYVRTSLAAHGFPQHALADRWDDVDPDWPEKRAMFGQSPYVINSYLNYHHFERGWDVNLGFNVAGEKLILVNKAATPDVYEQPFPMLDFNISKQFKN